MNALPADEYCLLFVNWWPLCMNKAEWSGWVQAIGSITAIAAAALVALWQIREGRRATAEARRALRVQRLNAVSVVLSTVQALFQLAHHFVEREAPMEDWITLRDEVADIRAVMSGIPLLELPGVYLPQRIAITAQNLRFLASLIPAIRDPLHLEDKAAVLTDLWGKYETVGAAITWCAREIELHSSAEERAEIAEAAAAAQAASRSA